EAEDDCVDAGEGGGVWAELFVDAIVPSLAQEVEIEAGQCGGEAVGIVQLEGMAVPIRDAETIADGQVPGDHALPQRIRVERLEGLGGNGATLGEHGDLGRPGGEGADGKAAVRGGMRAEHREGIAVLSGDQGLDHAGGEVHGHRYRSSDDATRRSGSGAPPARRGSGTGPCRVWSRARGR